LAASSEIQIWQSATASRVLPTSSSDATVESSSASDTATVVTVYGLNSDYEERQADVTLNGTTPVTVSGIDWRINKLRVKSGTLVGELSAKIGSDVQALIKATEFESNMTQRTVPADREAEVNLMSVRGGDLSGAGCVVQLVLRYKLHGSTVWQDAIGAKAETGTLYNNASSFAVSRTIPAKAEIACYARCEAGTASFWSSTYWFELFDTI